MIVLDCIIGAIVTPLVLMTVVLLFGTRLMFVRKTRCRIGWHSAPNLDVTGFDGASIHARCRWCGYEGMIDSQGNLF